MSGIFKEKPLGFYIGLVSPVLSVIVAIIILLYGMSVNDFYAIPPVLLLIGAGCACVGLFCKIHFFMILPGACYMGAAATYISSQLVNISAKISGNGLGETGTSIPMITFFVIAMLITIIFAILSSFMKQTKSR